MSVQTPPETDRLRERERSFESISPFEFKNELIHLASPQDKQSARTLLNAGRGNPNWIAATPREAFHTLGQFAGQESRRVWQDADLAGKPERSGIAARFNDYASNHADDPGMSLLRAVIDYGVQRHQFDADEWVHELVDGVIGDNYPEPDRMLTRMERVVHDYLVQEMCQGKADSGRFDLFAVEGATAAMCYLFDTLLENYLLARGDRVALITPIFPPYVEIPQLARYAFDVIEIQAIGIDADGRHTWQVPPEELDKLRDPEIKALFLVNPSNPPSVALPPDAVAHLQRIVRERQPQLMIISDDVYGTFVDGYRSLLADLPANTISVYSFSKYFGVTGWRLGVIAVHQDNVFDQRIDQLPADKREILHKRYSSLSQHPEELRFIDRLVADSRQVALNHTAGLSTPQQVQMALFAAFALLDTSNRYKHLTQDICRRRMKLLYEGLGLPQPQLEYPADYYTQFDLADWAQHHFGQAFRKFLEDKYEPVDILFRLAQQSSIVLLNGGGFHGPNWSIRVSLANLNDDDYRRIGEALKHVLGEYVREWKASRNVSQA